MSKLTEPRLDRLVLEPPCPFLTANQRLHWRKKAELTKAWRELARTTAEPLVASGVSYERVHVYAHLRFPDNRKRDVANWYPTVKAAIDGAVASGLLPFGDHDEVLIGPDMRRETPNGPPRLTLEIRELT